jgi:hypothetical protein
VKDGIFTTRTHFFDLAIATLVTAVSGEPHQCQVVADQLYSSILTAVIGVSGPIGDLEFTVSIGRTILDS